jgi:hypothetical protein
MLFFALIASQPVRAQSPSASALDSLSWVAGNWRGTGTMFGRPTEASLVIGPALGGRFLEFSYRAGTFEGRAFYRPLASGAWQASWFDNRGIAFPIAGRVEGQALTSDWGSAETEHGRTVYRLAEDGRLHVSDSVRRPDGSYREFASHVLTRAQ